MPRLYRSYGASLFHLPRTAGGVVFRPPSVFFRDNFKTDGGWILKLGIPVHWSILRHHLKNNWSSQVRSPGHDNWPDLKKSLTLCQIHIGWSYDLKLLGKVWGPIRNHLYISIFLYRWPEVRSLFEVTHTFSEITHKLWNVEARQDHHSVSHIKTRRYIDNMTWFGQWTLGDLDLRSNIELDLLGSKCVCFEPPWLAINHYTVLTKSTLMFDDLWSQSCWS